MITKPTTGASAFEDVLYGSESEIEDSDEDDDGAEASGRRKDVAGGARLRIDADEPLDFLQGAASHITSASFPHTLFTRYAAELSIVLSCHIQEAETTRSRRLSLQD